LTREIAQRGREQAPSKLRTGGAERFSHHLAMVLDSAVLTRPIINFKENPDGIDPRVGAQISGSFMGKNETKNLAAVLRGGKLPAALEPVGHRPRG
jgi:preprotein translocase subunit SecD